MTLTDTILPDTRGVDRNPVTLAHKLTEGKQTDKQKFDVIFTWVTRNIRYDYGLYLSPHGSTQPNIKRILRRKKGICLDYAALMDTLCEVAGLQNVSVYGYTKDELFDVHDSIYMDNHAWNAVKLDNYWYLYDATWSSGYYAWKFRRISEWIYKWKLKIIAKSKERNLTFKTPQTECDKGGEAYQVKLMTLNWRQSFILKMLNIFPLHIKLYFVPPVNPLYYISDPEIFAITHFPDNPYWSLTGNYKTIVDFEKDSAYYHLTDEVLLSQKREGRHCGQCDDYFALDEMQKVKQMKKNSYNFNRKNAFVMALCDYELAGMFYEKSEPEIDSVAKVSLLDSAITHLQSARADFQQSSRYVSKESAQQRMKNNTKMKRLYEENNNHINFVRSMISMVNKETEKMRKFSLKKSTVEHEFKVKKKELLKLSDNLKDVSSYKVNKKLEAVKLKLSMELKTIDSMHTEIEKVKNTFNSTAVVLSDRLWKEVRMQRKLSVPFEFGTFHRLLNQNDNYKKVIVTERDKIKQMEESYAAALRDSIFKLSDSCADKGNQIFKLLRQRNDFFTLAAKMINTLVNAGYIPADSLHNYISFCSNRIQADMCWIIARSSVLQASIIGFEQLKYGQQELIKTIKKEKRAEYKRYRMVNKEINRRTIKFKNIPAQNLRSVSSKSNKVKQVKRMFLKKLKEERKMAKK